MRAIVIDEVTVELGGATIIDRLSASVARGSWVGVIGPNGAGKTTILRAICGLIGFRGRITVENTSVRESGRRALSQCVTLVPQDPVFPPALSVAEYVLLGRTAYKSAFSGEGRADRKAAGRAIEQLDLLAFAGRPLSSLSGGERQRAVLARALAQEAPVLLLDEPTSALDIGRQQRVLSLVEQLRGERGLTVLAAMHDLTLAAQHADRLVLVDQGRVVVDGEPRVVLDPARLQAHYGASVRVLEVDGRPAVVPIRQEAPV